MSEEQNNNLKTMQRYGREYLVPENFAVGGPRPGSGPKYKGGTHILKVAVSPDKWETYQKMSKARRSWMREVVREALERALAVAKQ